MLAFVAILILKIIVTLLGISFTRLLESRDAGKYLFILNAIFSMFPDYMVYSSSYSIIPRHIHFIPVFGLHLQPIISEPYRGKCVC